MTGPPPPPPELVAIAQDVAAKSGLDLEFTMVIEEGHLVWSVKVRTDRGTVTSIPEANTDEAWLEVLNDLGLIA